jgi:hypothetical protein
MSFGDWLIRLTAWLAFALWVVVVSRLLRGAEHGNVFGWLAGGLVMLVHVVLAFQFRHHWSHAAAIVETARQTEELTGFDRGGGVWLNYLFTAVWLGDAFWRVLQPESHAARPGWLRAGVHGFLAFMWFNATVVFGSAAIQIAGVTAFGWLAVQAWKRATAGRLRTSM